MTITVAISRAAALDDLDFYSGDVYDFAFSRAKWVARTGDGSRTLLADSPQELRELIEADYQSRAVPRRDTHEGRSAMDEAAVRALKELDVHWGEVYAVTLSSHGWMARRRDNGYFLVAATPEDLEELIEADAEVQPVRLGMHVYE
jgi:hypothetical protein